MRRVACAAGVDGETRYPESLRSLGASPSGISSGDAILARRSFGGVKLRFRLRGSGSVGEVIFIPEGTR